MFRELINKLKSKRQQLQKNNNVNEPKSVEENKIDIIVSKENNWFKIEISDYISIGDYVDEMKSSDKYTILETICNCILWNNKEQKFNKGTYYVINNNNYLYNILFTGEKIKIDERIQKEKDEQTEKENITQERVIAVNINKNNYHYYSAKHELNGNTYYTKYYDKTRTYSLGALDLAVEETYEEVKSVISNLESIEGIEQILNIQLLKEFILNDLSRKIYDTNRNIERFEKIANEVLKPAVHYHNDPREYTPQMPRRHGREVGELYTGNLETGKEQVLIKTKNK